MKNSRESYMNDVKDPMHNMAPDLLKLCQHIWRHRSPLGNRPTL